MVQEKKVSADGYSVFWVMTAPLDRQKLEANLKTFGLERFLPNERTDYDALVEAYKTMYHGKDFDVVSRRDKAKDGVEVIRIKRGTNGNCNGYELEVACRVVNSLVGSNVHSQVEVLAGTTDLPKLQALYDAAKAVIPCNAVGTMLSNLVTAMRGTALRPTGGFYWISPAVVDVFRAVEAAIVSSVAGDGRTDLYLMTLQMTVETARAVRDALMEEVLAETRKIADEVDSEKCGERALESRKQRALALDAKVKEYEAILQETLPALHEACEQAGALAFEAMMKVRSEGEAAVA